MLKVLAQGKSFDLVSHGKTHEIDFTAKSVIDCSRAEVETFQKRAQKPKGFPYLFKGGERASIFCGIALIEKFMLPVSYWPRAPSPFPMSP
jgi:hypothetical protein